jgi:hypothetical protein
MTWDIGEFPEIEDIKPYDVRPHLAMTRLF